jgi:hypothetical protein
MNAIKNVLSKFFGKTPATGEEFSWVDLFTFAEEEVKLLNTHRKNNEDITTSLTSMRLMGPLYEMAEKIDIEGTYRKEDIIRLEMEIRNIINDAISRGFFDGKKITVREFSKMGIELNAFQLMLI